MRRLILTIGLFLTILFSLAACGNGTEEGSYDLFRELKDDLLVEIGETDTLTMHNDIKRTSGGELVQHLRLSVHTERAGKVYLTVEDMLAEGGPVLVNYLYASGRFVYLYDNHGHFDADAEVKEEYYVKTREDMEGQYPNPFDIITYQLDIFPDERFEEKRNFSITDYSVSYNRKAGSFDTVVSVHYDGPEGTDDIEWILSGDMDDFTLENPDPNTGTLRFIRQDFFADFEGIDESKHEMPQGE